MLFFNNHLGTSLGLERGSINTHSRYIVLDVVFMHILDGSLDTIFGEMHS